MSYSWRLSSGGASGSRASSEQPALGSTAVDTPPTPPSVRNVTPSTCLSIVQFRALMQEYRSLDDSITTRMNRALAKSRATGETSSPSLLSAHATSSNPTTSDLGRSTYGTATQGECARFWRELVDVWTGRDEVLNYCLAVAAQAQGAAAASPAERLGLQRGNGDEKRLLDADLPRDVRGALDAVGQRQQRGAKADDFDSRDSRSEKSQDLVKRQLRNEVSIEAIIRKRSLEVLKSRCRFFQPAFTNDDRGRREQTLWEQQ
ncbi:hypothetical protein FA10DRAFT_302847 [Acaromyces ingoldii]|uniref:Caffeine-induced death protein 2 n=1 Tax=Acaromyces ingoldii TaxID=215250 RepID=A0A316YN82_9BASI|nr:hypothetical protein FA10DRAFT_302847 [Acaromyces ingoldii]PWN89523.1 hypothetical protein FA10DRAFT_302847 [Acaromyces ingoldii]